MKTIIIAEAGVNHNGSMDLAKKLIDAAKEARADYVKFQTFKADSLVSKYAEKADYQKKTTDCNESQYEMIKKLELGNSEHRELIEYCNLKKIRFLSTAFDIKSIDLLVKYKVPFLKIPSGEITNLPYLKHVGSKKMPVVMSTGMSTMSEVGDALAVLIDAGISKKNITILHCNTEYPTPYTDVNLKAMISIKNKFGVKVGYSDHTNGIEIAIAAASLGASIVEKHFTINKNLPGPDHAASLEPDELRQMVESIHNINNALGNGVKGPSDSEANNISTVRKSIVANKEIKKGEKFSIDNLTIKRPGTGISPMKWDSIIGKISNFDFLPDELIKL